MTEQEAALLFAELRWGDRHKQICPRCGEITSHYFRSHRLQWRCKGCDHCFSATSGTVFDRHRLDLKTILMGIHLYLCSAKGISALNLTRVLGIAHKTACVFLGKLRELLVREADRRPLKGRLEVDGGYFGGKPRKPRRRQRITVEEVQEKLANKGKRLPPRNANARLNWFKRQKRRVVFVLRELHPSGAAGAARTIVAVAKSENEADALTFIHRYAIQNSLIMSDENAAYNKLCLNFQHRTVEHRIEFSTDDGVNENQAESFYSRLRRMEYGVTHRMTPTYLMDYAQEMAWREDTRRYSTGEKLRDVFAKLNRAGRSQWWRGYWQGKRRGHELLLPDLIALDEGSLP